MKITILLFAFVATTVVSFGQTKPPVKKPVSTAKPQVSKFGALAIDRSNGFYYGWSFDYATLAEAEKKAIEECNSKGGNCTVVLSYSGTGCAAYRTVDGNQGTAFGWGLAKTKEEADVIATKECLKRSNGTNATNFVWSCNSANTGKLKEIYNASGEILNSVKIGDQEWSTSNLAVVKFNNGELIPESKTKEEWMKYSKEKKPSYCNLCNLVGQKDCGMMYNIYAVLDPRGLSPKGWSIPTEDDWKILIAYLGGESKAGKELSNSDWSYTKGNNSSGFNASPCDWIRGELKPTYDYGKRGVWWSKTKVVWSKTKWPTATDESYWALKIDSYDTSIDCELSDLNYYYGSYIRCLKD